MRSFQLLRGPAGRNFGRAFPHSPFFQKKGRDLPVRPPAPSVPDVVDFRYAPSSWQSTYCFPDDPYKSIVGNSGELLYGYPRAGAAYDKFPQIVSVGIKDSGDPKFVSQNFEAPGIPIVMTNLEFAGVLVTLTTFATDHKSEGRVDNLLVQIHPKEKPEVEGSRRHDTSPNLRDIAAKSRSAQRGTVKKASPA